MGFSEAMEIGNCNIHGPEKKINESLMSISQDFYETTVGSVF